jgi:hypothetical protein
VDLPDPKRTPKTAWLPVTSGLRSWRAEMPAEDVERFEAAVGDLLDVLGYTRAFPDPSPPALEHASEIRDQFVRDIRSRRGLLPERRRV